MSSTVLIAAAACAAHLMGAQPVLPDHFYPQRPGQALCLFATGALPGEQPACNGVFRVDPASGETTITALPRFGTLVHESCHAIQHAAGRPIAEAECYAVQARAGECFAGEGAAGMYPPARPDGLSAPTRAIFDDALDALSQRWQR